MQHQPCMLYRSPVVTAGTVFALLGADDLLARFALTGAGDRRVSTYSGGMRRRLDIAMGNIGDPAVAFLDEPTTGLDPERRREVWRTVGDLADHGTTVLLTTQYLEETEALADRIAILHRGRIIVDGTLDELKQILPPAQVEYVERRPGTPTTSGSSRSSTSSTDSSPTPTRRGR